MVILQTVEILRNSQRNEIYMMKYIEMYKFTKTNVSVPFDSAMDICKVKMWIMWIKLLTSGEIRDKSNFSMWIMWKLCG